MTTLEKSYPVTRVIEADGFQPEFSNVYSKNARCTWYSNLQCPVWINFFSIFRAACVTAVHVYTLEEHRCRSSKSSIVNRFASYLMQ